MAIHFTSGHGEREAFETLQKILQERRLIASSEKIKGGHRCVCFTEAPLDSFSEEFVNWLNRGTRYKMFGLMFTKEHLFAQGNRHVIYQPASEYRFLSREISWRHASYDLGGEIDFTWEREWRIRCDEFTLEPSSTRVLVPDDDWADCLELFHEWEQDIQVVRYQDAHKCSWQEAVRHRLPFFWTVMTRNNFNIRWPVNSGLARTVLR